ncbi:unnamed protein product [Staurois parvus]|uniref:Uncharacterized protein n=1 Tax=Staurois parvus TaxID=386267 RepID=A0ABN9E3R4_9NEOB|nr:unnamed protein product [Staurois parvus]
MVIAALYFSAQQRNTKHTQHTVKHTQHTFNPLISQKLTPSCPVSLVQCQCFLLALITVLVSLGMSVAVSQFPPPQYQNACRSPAISR